MYAGRIEDLAKERKGQFSVLTARALSSLPSLMELASPLLKKGGRLICYKAQPTDEEVENALGIQELVGLRLECDQTFRLSDGSTRRIFVFEKTGTPRIKLPRRIGLAQKESLYVLGHNRAVVADWGSGWTCFAQWTGRAFKQCAGLAGLHSAVPRIM